MSVSNTTGVFVNHAVSSVSVTGCSASVSTFFLTNHSYYSTKFPRHYMRLPTLQAYSDVIMSQGDDVYISQTCLFTGEVKFIGLSL